MKVSVLYSTHTASEHFMAPFPTKHVPGMCVGGAVCWKYPWTKFGRPTPCCEKYIYLLEISLFTIRVQREMLVMEKQVGDWLRYHMLSQQWHPDRRALAVDKWSDECLTSNKKWQESRTEWSWNNSFRFTVRSGAVNLKQCYSTLSAGKQSPRPSHWKAGVISVYEMITTSCISVFPVSSTCTLMPVT